MENKVETTVQSPIGIDPQIPNHNTPQPTLNSTAESKNKNFIISLTVYLCITFILAVIFYYLDYPLFYLTLYLADIMSNGTSFIGFPIAIFPTMTITSLIRISLIF